MSLILDLLYPRTCFSCGTSGQYLCSDCHSKLVLKSIKKGDRLSLFRYYGAVKEMITSLKFNFVSDIIPEFSDFMAESIMTKFPNLLTYWQQNNFTLVPIPLHPRRLNWRGFNQSELICQQLSVKLKLNYNPDLLIRTKNTLPQTAIKDKLLRHTNIISSFKYCPPFLPAEQEGQGGIKGGFILFDDVYTTGSTIKSAKSVFPLSSEIWTLTIAG